MKTDVILVGGFHEIIELCEECNYNVRGIINDNDTGIYYDIPIIGTDNDAVKLFDDYKHCKVIVTPDSPHLRKELVSYYRSIGYHFTNLISPRAHISKYAEIGEGSVIQSGVNISAASKIGSFCKLNCNCNIMHDIIIEDYTTIAPNAVLLGKVEIGEKVYIGANSTLLPNIKVGNNAIIGAGAVVTRNVENFKTVKGVPAK